MSTALESYDQQVRIFAEQGGKIIRTEPSKHYRTGLGANARRPMEPGFIPPDKPAKVLTVSYYPNESDLATPEYEPSRKSFARWGASGIVDDYVDAYRDWVAMLPKVPFYRDFNEPVFREAAIGITEFAWLPLIKLPLPAKSKVDDDDIWVDRDLLWDQLRLLKPPVILAQGVEAYDRVRALCEDKFPHRIILQKIGRVGTNAYHAAEFERVARELRSTLAGT